MKNFNQNDLKEIIDINNFENLPYLEQEKKLKELTNHLPESIISFLFSKECKIKTNKNISNEDIKTIFKCFNKNKYLSSEGLHYLKKIIQHVAVISMSLESINFLFDIDYDIIVNENILKQYLLEKYNNEPLSCMVIINKINGLNENFIDNSKVVDCSIIENSYKIIKKLNLQPQKILTLINKENKREKKIELFVKILMKELLLSQINKKEIKTIIDHNFISIENNSFFTKINGFVLTLPVNVEIKMASEYNDKNEVSLVFNNKDECLNQFLNNFEMNILLKIHNRIKITENFIKNIKD